MTRKNKLILLLLVLVLLLGATLLTDRLNPENQVEEATPLLALDDRSITGLTWTWGEETLTFTQADGVWTYPEDQAFPLDQSQLTAMTDTLAALSAEKTIGEPQDLSQYGLDDPVCTIDVTLTDSSVRLTIGGESTLDGLRYLSTGSEMVYLVDAALLDAFSYGLYDLIAKEYIPAMTSVESFQVETAGTTWTLSTQETEGGDAWLLREEDGSTTLDTALTETFVETVTWMSWGDCVTYDANEDALALYGLDSPTATVTVDYTEVTDQGEQPGTFVLELGDISGEFCYGRIAGSSMVYLVNASILETLTSTTPEDLLPTEEPEA